MADGIPGYWSVIPAPVRNDPQLKMSAKLLYADISALCAESGYCWATNAYLAERMGVAVSTISRLVHQLEQQGYVRTEMVATDQGSERHIYAGIFHGGASPGGSTQKEQDPPGSTQKRQGGSTQKEQDPYKDDKDTVIYTPLNPPKKPKKKRAKEPDWLPERFEAFWKAYPHDYRGNKAKARRAWNELRPEGTTLTAMARALKHHMKSERWVDGIGIPNASTYINPENGYWELADAERAAPDPATVSGPSTVVESRYEKL